jgi:hypothetical protein
VLGTVLVLWYGKVWGATSVATAAILLVLATLTAGGIMERKRWAWPLEGVRIVTAVVAVAVLGGSP